MRKQRIVVTGIGSCSAAGNSKDLWRYAYHKRSCLSEYQDSGPHDSPVKVVGQVKSDLTGIFSKRVESFITRHALLAASAMQECLQNAGPDAGASARTGLIFGSASHGGDLVAAVANDLRDHSLYDIDCNKVNSVTNAGACQLLASNFGINGYVHAVEAASSSGMLTLATGFNLIKSGICDRVFCVVGEANLVPATFLFYARRARVGGISMSFFGKLKNADSRTASEYVVPFGTPHDSDRGAIAEAGGAILLESLDSALERQAHIFGEIEDVSFSFHSDNFRGADKHLQGPKMALTPFKEKHIDSLYMPITGSYILDPSLYHACGHFFPQHHAFSAEPIIGHTGAATALLNAALALQSLTQQTLLPTLNYEDGRRDPECRLIPSTEIITDRPVDKILLVSAGWGGFNGAGLVKRYEP